VSVRSHRRLQRGASGFTKLYNGDKPQKSRSITFAVIAISQRRKAMSEYDPQTAIPTPPPPRRANHRSAYLLGAIAVGLTAVALFASASFSDGLRHGLVNVRDMTAENVRDTTVEHAAFEGRFGPPFGGWDSFLPNSVIEAFIDARADRMIRHLAVEIEATNEQQDKLKAIVHETVKDVLPARDKMLAARATARELLTQPTIDRAALEKLRADQIATHEAVSKQLVQAVADAADALTPDQRRKIIDMLPPGGPGFGRESPRWGWGGFWRH
jgi:protein CpxP